MGLAKGLYFLIDQTWVMFLVAFLLFMFCPPELKVPPFDRIAFVLLILLVLMDSLRRRWLQPFKSPIMLPMIAMTTIATVSAIQAPYNIETWSIMATTFIVPYTMFFLAKAVFRDDRIIRYFFIFSALVAAYLTFIAIAFLLDVRSLIFPRYILDSKFLARACGPFLNPVANGTAIIMLGLVSLHWYLKMQRGLPRILLFLLLIALPFAILATLTRGVWLSCLFAIAFFSVTKYPNIRKALIIWLVFASLGIWLASGSKSLMGVMSERLHDQQNITFRLNLYPAAFAMFKEKPLLGWGTNVAPFVVDRYLEAYRGDVWLHNTYLDVLVGQGIVGFLFYVCIIVSLFGIGRHIPRSSGEKDANMIDRGFVLVWRNILCVYLINGTFVVMNYQFTNALIFTIAGIISAREAGLTSKRVAK